jgi:hypothetical protein
MESSSGEKRARVEHEQEVVFPFFFVCVAWLLTFLFSLLIQACVCVMSRSILSGFRRSHDNNC